MHENLVAVNESTVIGMGQLARFFGFNDVMGRLFGVLLLSPEAMSLDDLAGSLQISKGSVSMNMRALERWGVAKEHWVRGERKKYYKAESDIWKVVHSVLNGRERREVSVALQVLADSVESLKSAEAELTPEEIKLKEYYLERIVDLQAFFSFAHMALESVLGSDNTIAFEEVTRIDIL
ncbi:MAG TPA: hypothetical protein ENJ56_00150 [Anaerolineae bacterium]|nr:hypothetical protein [Anaerolineae bacterium]